jgi:hypothetical protein
MKQHFLILWMVIGFSFSGIKAGKAQSATPVLLTETLKQISAHYQVNFLYEELNLSTKKVNFNPTILKDNKLDAALNSLLKPLLLDWSKIDGKNYSIYPADPGKGNRSRTEGPAVNVKARSHPDSLRQDSLRLLNLRTDSAFARQETNLLSEVQIKANRATVESKSDRLVYNVANSAMASGNSIQLLKTAPFVKVSADNTVSLQGKSTMVMIDNKPIAESSLQNILQTLPAGNIAQIELITNPSAKYDAAYGAVINIITKKSKIEGLTGNVRVDASTGMYGIGTANSSLTYKHGNLTIYGTGGFTHGNDYFSVDEDRTVGLTNSSVFLTNNWSRHLIQDIGSYQAGADLDLGKGQTIGLIADGNLMHFKGPWTTINGFRMAGSSQADSILYTNASFEQPVYMNNFNLNYHLLTDSGKNELTALATYTPFRRNLKQNFPSVLEDANGVVLDVPPLYRTTNITAIDVYIAQLDYTHLFDGQWKLETGLKYQQSNSRNEISYETFKSGVFEQVPLYSSNNQLRESITGIYGIVSKDWAMDKLQLGLRAEDTRAAFVGNFKQHSFNLFPTLMYQHNVSQQNNFSFSFKRTIARAPYYELVPYAVFLNKYTVEQGNPSLKPSYNNVFTLGANLHKVNVSIAYTATSDLMALFPVKEEEDTRLTYFSRRNLDKAFDYSMYLYFPLKLATWWETQNSGTILGYNRVEGMVLSAKYTLGAFHSDFKSSQIFQLATGFKLQIDAYYWTKYAQDLTNYSGYKNIDAAVLIDLFGAKGQLRLGGQQLLFKRNDYRSQRTFGAYQISDVVGTDSRRASIGFTYKFGKTSIKSPEKKLGNEEAMKRL